MSKLQHCWDRPEYWEEPWKLEETSFRSNSCGKPSTNTDVKMSEGVKIVDFAVSADHRINLKESEKKDKYLDLSREFKKLWNMKVTIMPIVIGAFGTITKGLLKALEDFEIGGQVETIQTTALLRTARILRRVLETWGDLLSLKSVKLSVNTDVKNSKGVNNNNNNNNNKLQNPGFCCLG